SHHSQKNGILVEHERHSRPFKSLSQHLHHCPPFLSLPLFLQTNRTNLSRSSVSLSLSLNNLLHQSSNQRLKYNQLQTNKQPLMRGLLLPPVRPHLPQPHENRALPRASSLSLSAICSLGMWVRSGITVMRYTPRRPKK